MTAFAIRDFHTSDLYMLYRICLETGADGADATGTIDQEILGHYFAAPYAVLEPGLCSILTADGAPCGYILGTEDSERFAAQSREQWFGPLREKYPLRDAADTSREAGMVRSIHAGYQAPPWSADYPAHLHLDILPEGQGNGHGGRLIATFLDQLRARKVGGVHLGVSRANRRAIAYYPRFGFNVIAENERSVAYGKLLED